MAGIDLETGKVYKASFIFDDAGMFPSVCVLKDNDDDDDDGSDDDEFI